MEISDEMIDAAARKICDEWGYDWDVDPDADNQGAPDVPGDYDERPSKMLYRMAARAALEAVAPAIRAAAMEEAAVLVETHTYTVSNREPAFSLQPSPRAKDDMHHRTIAAAIRAAKETA